MIDALFQKDFTPNLNHSFHCSFLNSYPVQSPPSVIIDICESHEMSLPRSFHGFHLVVEFIDTVLIFCLCIVVFGVLILHKHRRLQCRINEVDAQYQNENHTEKMYFLHRVGLDVYGYSSTPGGYIDDWRPEEIPSLILPISLHGRNENQENEECEVYVDYAGSALPTQTQLTEVMAHSSAQLLANPHSLGPASARTHRLVEQAKRRVLDHFSANAGALYGGTRSHDAPQDIRYHPGYEIIFTSGTTDALRIVAEHFPWGNGQATCQCPQRHLSGSSLFVYPQNSHTSVVGMREVALQQAKTEIVCQPVDVLIETIVQQASSENGCIENTFRRKFIPRKKSAAINEDESVDVDSCGCASCMKHLLVLPMECNFDGDRPDVQLAFRKLQECAIVPHGTSSGATNSSRCKNSQSWYTLLDMAKAACTSPINLCQLNPDFACISFYKMFGEPTGLGCLFVKRTAMPMLSSGDSSRKYVGGGSVDVIVPGRDFTVRRSEPFVSLTHGTPHFRGIVALLSGFNELDRRGGMQRIQKHTLCLAQEFVFRLKNLKHSSGLSAIVIYGEWKHFSGMTTTKNSMLGPTVAFNVRRSDGSYVGYNEVSKLAVLFRPAIQVRTGCFCNPGACQLALGLSDDDVVRNYKESGHVCGDAVDIINGLPTGAVRVSFGKDSIWEDMNAVITFLEQMFVNQTNSLDKSNVDLSGEKGASLNVVITELYIFPIKSCAAQRVSDWPMDVTSGRLQFDREFALVDASGSAMRLQMYPAMALLRPTVDLKTQTLTVKAPSHSTSLQLELNTESSYQTERNGAVNIVKVCGDRCGGILWGDQFSSDWFSQYLGVRCWLARHSSKVHGRYELPDLATTSIPPLPPKRSSLSFANEQPLLLISEQAVHILNEALQMSSKQNSSMTAVCSRQFRPNIVVRIRSDPPGLTPAHQYQIEDRWSRVLLLDSRHGAQASSMSFEVVGPCARCAMVDIDPSSGCRGGKTLRALARYRRRGNGQITFGIFLRVGLTSPSSTDDAGISWQYIKEGDTLLCEGRPHPEPRADVTIGDGP
jgi:molybdenum cofactor sulfurtransferase